MGFLEALSAIGGLAGGIGQGERQNQQLKLQKAEADRQRALTNETILSNIRQQVTAHPELKDNPNYNNITKMSSKKFGIDLPMRPDGNIDWDAMVGGKQDIMQALPPEQLGTLREKPEDVQRAYASQYTDKNNFFGQGADRFKQEVPLTPKDPEQAKANIFRALSSIPTGKATPSYIDSVLNLYGGDIPGFDKDKFIESVPGLFSQVGADLQAKIDNMHRLKEMSDERYKAIEQQIKNGKSLNDFRQVEETHFRTMDTVALGNLQERIHKDQVDRQQAEERIQISREHLQIALDKAKTGGAVNTPAKVISKEKNDLQGYIRTLQAQLNSDQSEAQRQTSDGNDVPQALHDEINDLHDKLQTNLGLLSDLQAHDQDIQNAQLRSLGVNVKNPTQDNGSDLPKTRVNPANHQTYYLWPDGKYYQKPPQ